MLLYRPVCDIIVYNVMNVHLEPHPDLDKQFIAKRFPIQQKEKTRLIDDFSICGVNSAFGMAEKLRVDAIDEILAGISVLLDSEGFTGKNKGLLWEDF